MDEVHRIVACRGTVPSGVTSWVVTGRGHLLCDPANTGTATTLSLEHCEAYASNLTIRSRGFISSGSGSGRSDSVVSSETYRWRKAAHFTIHLNFQIRLLIEVGLCRCVCLSVCVSFIKGSYCLVWEFCCETLVATYIQLITPLAGIYRRAFCLDENIIAHNYTNIMGKLIMW